MLRAAVLGLVIVLGGCSGVPEQSSSVQVQSAAHPGLAIECQGEPLPSEADCVAWAESVLSAPPGDIPAETTKLELSDRGGGGRCAAEYADRDGRILLSVSITCPRR